MTTIPDDIMTRARGIHERMDLAAGRNPSLQREIIAHGIVEAVQHHEERALTGALLVIHHIREIIGDNGRAMLGDLPSAVRAAIDAAEARALMDERARCARLARITHPNDADFSGVWGEYEHGCDDTQGAIHAAILKGEA